MSEPGNFWWRTRNRLAAGLGLDLTHSQDRYARVLSSYITPGIRWLEVGCGRQIVPEWVVSEAEQKRWAERAGLLVGIDVDRALVEHQAIHARVYGRAGELPFAHETFDLISANMVAEHFTSPLDILRDIHRALRPGGRFLFHTPNLRYYLVRLASWMPDWIKGIAVSWLESRKEEDRFQTFYRINTREDIARLANESGFIVEHLRVQGSVGSFGNAGPLGWLECFILKLVETLNGGKWNSNLVVCLRKA